MAGAVTPLLGEQYFNVLQQVLSSSIVDTPVNYTKQFELFAFNSSDAVYVYSDEADPSTLLYIEFNYAGLEDVQFLSSGLFNSSVILDADNYFEVVDGTIRFYIDIFQDATVLANAYAYETQQLPDSTIETVLLWASSITVTETYLYDRYGRYLYTKQVNSESYKAILTALQFFFTSTKSIKNIENVINILFNLPFSRTNGEVVESIETLDSSGQPTEDVLDYNANATADSPDEMKGFGWYQRVITTDNTYFVPLFADLVVAVGDTLEKYQLLCRLNRAYDYITDPDWSADAKFPFELVDELEDYSVLSTPPEYEPYRPQKADGSVFYTGQYFYTGVFSEYNGIDPFLGTRSKVDGTEFEQTLYGLVDTVMKYNLLYFKTILTYENYEYYANGQMTDALQAVAQGIPSYLYPVMETIFKSALIDKFDDFEGEFSYGVTIGQDSDEYQVCPYLSYGGDVSCPEPPVATYSGVVAANPGSLQAFLISTAEDFYSCETEQGSMAVSLSTDEDAFSVLGLAGDTTFGRPMVQSYYNGFFNTDGTVPTFEVEEEFSQELLRVSTKDEDDCPVEDMNESAVVGITTGMSDIVTPGGYDGTVPMDTTVLLVAGADALVYQFYDDAFTYDGTTEASLSGYVIDPTLAVPADGSYSYSGYREIKQSYGGSATPFVNITDDLHVNITYATA